MLAWARRAGLPALAVRAVADGPDDDVPRELLGVVGADGRGASAAVARLLGRPALVGAAWRLGRRSHRALDSLARFVQAFVDHRTSPEASRRAPGRLPARAAGPGGGRTSYSFFPLPAFDTDPNEGETYGVLPVWMFRDEQERVRSIIAPVRDVQRDPRGDGDVPLLPLPERARAPRVHRLVLGEDRPRARPPVPEPGRLRRPVPRRPPAPARARVLGPLLRHRALVAEGGRVQHDARRRRASTRSSV